jgi:hypothetical protein
MICWIAIGLVAAMHWPMDALVEHAGDFYCWVAAVTLNDPGESAKEDVSHEMPAILLGRRVGNPVRTASAMGDLPRAMKSHAIPAIQPWQPDGEMCCLLQSWQFSRRMALAPRAPSAFV